MKVKKIVILILASIVAICVSIAVHASPEKGLTISEQIEALYEQLDTFRFPTSEKALPIERLTKIDDIAENPKYLFGDENSALLSVEGDIRTTHGMVYKCNVRAGVVYLNGTVGYNAGSPQITFGRLLLNSQNTLYTP